MTNIYGQVNFFMLPKQFFDLLARFVLENRATLVFQRFDSDEFEAGYSLVREQSDPAQVYRVGGFRVIYLSLGCIPTHSTDWDFHTRCNEELIEISLGRTAPGQIAMSEARLYIPGGPAQPMLDALEREIAAICRLGVRGRRHIHTDIYWSEDVRSMELYGGALGKEQARAWPMED